ncbi:nuclear transport factor 2 family protein [Chryseobacterium sp. BIGb0232]|uniref:nuclear transport factor 2 family protein n=1 Tax=Chryseobacterium sp. BIGb0232 TaxID=2940598 RepID=UPI001E4D6EDF|nr:nuclear transport factor 2 family protein [Chryseobacterium sp. BIGb0232]MCS4304084.1 putative small lipoprotein YifL [Chryseobacterium sp. BIGb0232]
MIAALLILFPKNFMWGNFLMATGILLIICFHHLDKDLKGVLIELPFLLMNLIIIYLQYSLKKYIIMKSLVIIAICLFSFTACGQQKSSSNSKTNKTQQNNNMDTSKLTNNTVKTVFEAWQKGDNQAFLSYFTADAKLYDDGNPRDFQKFVKDACGHERFTSIDKVENDGKEIFGNFHTESWGDFRTYFKFHFDADGKISRLDIGQAN